MTFPTIAFIGGGNMVRSLVGGLLAQDCDPAGIHVAEPADAVREALASDFGIQTYPTAAEAVESAHVWLFAVKPQVMRTVCESLSPLAQTAKPLVVSVAAGITSTQLEHWLGGGLGVVRAMPNTPALLGAARMLVESGEAPDELRKRVTSPNGTTQAALESFERDDLRAIVARAVHAARERGRELSATND
jgi:pyrroline-5-carboxylate reductase